MSSNRALYINNGIQGVPAFFNVDPYNTASGPTVSVNESYSFESTKIKLGYSASNDAFAAFLMDNILNIVDKNSNGKIYKSFTDSYISSLIKDSDSTEYIYTVSKELVELIPDYNKFPLMSETDKILNCKNDYCTLIQNDYLLSKCFRNSYTIPLDMNRSNNVFGMKLDSINSKFLKNNIKEKEESYKKDLDFTNFINKTKSLNTNKWTILFQLKLSKI